jgi:hypothetical protein
MVGGRRSLVIGKPASFFHLPRLFTPTLFFHRHLLPWLPFSMSPG